MLGVCIDRSIYGVYCLVCSGSAEYCRRLAAKGTEIGSGSKVEGAAMTISYSDSSVGDIKLVFKRYV
jgi:hypothetical protein